MTSRNGIGYGRQCFAAHLRDEQSGHVDAGGDGQWQRAGKAWIDFEQFADAITAAFELDIRGVAQADGRRSRDRRLRDFGNVDRARSDRDARIRLHAQARHRRDGAPAPLT
jgi:hypothetical protein